MMQSTKRTLDALHQQNIIVYATLDGAPKFQRGIYFTKLATITTTTNNNNNNTTTTTVVSI